MDKIPIIHGSCIQVIGACSFGQQDMNLSRWQAMWQPDRRAASLLRTRQSIAFMKPFNTSRKGSESWKAFHCRRSSLRTSPVQIVSECFAKTPPLLSILEDFL